MNAPDVQAALHLGQRANEVAVAARTYLAEAREYLRARHAAGDSGRDVNRAHSDLIDGLVRRLFELSEAQYLNEGAEGPSEFCVVAVGGYARREMSIHSDVDLLCLYRDHVTPYVKAVAERLQTWLWDAQVTLGGAVRTLDDTIKLARGDTTVCTSLLAPRFLAGSGMLFHHFTRMVQDRLLDRPEAFIKSLIEATGARHTRYGDSLYLLQPNVKEGAGGLRDYHAAWWAMQAALSGTRNRSDLLHQGLLTHQEMSGMVAALEFLWRVRNEMHLYAGRKHDQMSFDLQEHIAQAFGYEPEGSEGLPVEGLMRDYYRHARNVLNSSSLAMEQCLARVAKPRRRRVRDVEDGLRVTDGQLEIPHALQLRRDPLLLLRAFAVAQRHDVPLTRKARRLIRENLDLIDDAYCRNPAAVAIFFDILRAERRVTRTLLAMNEVGLLARFLPEWDHIVNRWQHVMYHTYTVDVHSIFLVEEARRLWKGDFEKELPSLTQLVRDEEDLVPLILGCLLHDIGKGFGGDHSPKGAVLARTCLERLGADEELIETVVFLVREHLVMSHIAQRRDLSDPRLVLEFARTVGSRSRLRLLYLLTVVDIRASSKKAWTEWKGSLLQELFEKTSELLETGADDMERAMELFERRVETRRTAAAEELREERIPEAAIEEYFDLIPQRYFISHTPTQIARHARVATEHRRERLFTHGIKEMRGEFTEFILYTRDAHGLYSNVSGVLSAHNMNILGAHVYTTRDGMALEVYRVATPPGDETARELAWDEFLASLERVLKGETTVAELLRRRGRPISVGAPSPRQPEAVEISNEESDFYTIVDVLANDRIGLLHDLTRVIAEHGYEVYISKAGKVLDQISDTFYLKDADGRKISDEGAIEALRRDLLAAIRAG
ncbi:MAG TPA: [protein-PII] uridylyltransferase, partial [Myxococcota bacterium]|nr:[protein-PII] uridylyltransferase [Myxococcota bacterium]